MAIVGRPNVGKSSLFNRLVGRPIAIVDPTPGTTRDRLIHTVRRDGLHFDVIDTGGIGIVDASNLEADVYRQVERAIGAADRIVFLVDGREGLAHLDRQVAARLRPLKDRVVLAVNKLDHDGIDTEIHQFLSLGLGEPVGLSAAQARNISGLVEILAQGLPAAVPEPADDGRIAISIVGRRNVGKSSLTNALCGEERVIVADFAGTTRDAIDVPVDRPEGRFTLIDTAGLRKRAQIVEEDLEFYSACRTERAILRADVVLLVLDATDEVGTVDKKIAHFCAVESKPTILVVNKWDLAQDRATRDDYATWLRDRLPGHAHAAVVFTSALTGAHVGECLRLAVELMAECQARISTSEMNRLLEDAVARRRPRKMGPSPTKIYYATQADGTPPTIICFVNRTDWIESTWPRYFEHFLRERTPFRRCPIKILFKSRDSRFHGLEDEHSMVQGKNKADRRATLVRGRSARRRRTGGPQGAAPSAADDQEEDG
ncbi:MAG: GTPase Der [Planctomycetota bacterium]